MRALATRSILKIKLRWREFSFAMKALCILAILSCCIFGALLLTVGYIETVALSQPLVADAMFRHPHEVKGAIRFFTDRQEYIYSVSKPAMLGAFLTSAILSYAYTSRYRRLEDERRKEIMDKVATDFVARN
jgi:hypothetical protein